LHCSSVLFIGIELRKFEGNFPLKPDSYEKYLKKTMQFNLVFLSSLQFTFAFLSFLFLFLLLRFKILQIKEGLTLGTLDQEHAES
jgi:hypothetical protein